MTEDERVERALSRLSAVSARTVQAVIDEAERPDSIWAGRPFRVTGPFGANVADFVVGASFSRLQPDALLPAKALEASLLDPLVFRDVIIAHKGVDTLASVRSALGLAPSTSLAVDAVHAYGFDDVCLLLRVAAAHSTLQWIAARDGLKHLTGYAAGDALGDAAMEMHSMTAPFARFILKRRPTVDTLVRMMERGRFASLGISPSQFPPEAYRAELTRLSDRVQRGSRRRPPRSRKLPSRIAGWEQDSHMFLVPWRDKERIAADAGASVSVVGAPSLQHLVTRARARRLRWQARVLPALTSATLTLLVLSIERSLGSQVMLDVPSLLRDPILVASTWAAPLLAGLIVGLGLVSLSVFRERAFDELAAELGSRHVIGDIRRESAFVIGLRQLRPGAFTGRRHKPLPSTFTIASETNGLVVLGRGSKPERVAAFHWLNIVGVNPEPPTNNDVTLLGERRYRFSITVRNGDSTVSLPCSIARAKFDWASEATAWHHPFPLFVSRLDNGITAWTISRLGAADDAGAVWETSRRESTFVGTPFEAQVIEYELALDQLAESPSRVRYRRRLRTNISLILLIAAVGLFGPFALATIFW